MDYNKDVLRKLQLVQLDILKDIDSFCKENQISYFISYGTALGAIRHGGFIPWDDDIDICMKRDDYNRFVELAKEGMKDKYDILNIMETPGYISAFIKVSKKGTRFVEASNSNEEYEQGIFVDVFPYDYVAENEKQRKKDLRWAWILGRLCMLCEISDPIIPYEVQGWKRSVAIFGCKMAHVLLNLIGLDKKKVYRKYEKHVTKYNHKQGCTSLGDYSEVAPESTILREDQLFPPVDVQFENIPFPGPKDIHAYLTKKYGDYMQLPPVEARHNHVASLLDFGDGCVVNSKGKE